MYHFEDDFDDGVDKEEFSKEFEEIFHGNIYPIMCMASVEPLHLREGVIESYGITLPNFKQTFGLNFTVFRRKEDGPAHISFVMSSSNILTPPEIFSMSFDNPENEEAKEFTLRPINKFHPFKKAILLFDKRPYTLVEFEQTIQEWRQSLNDAIS